MSKDDLPRTKVSIRGKMLVAWLAEATPPVLWRFVASNITSGFGIRPAEGRVELVQYDGGTQPHVIATFASETSAERALSRLSQALIRYQAPWKFIAKTFAAVFGVLVLLTLFRVYVQYEMLISHVQGLASSVGHSPAASGSPLLALPGTPTTPPASTNSSGTGLPMGAPVDVDKAYK